MDLPADSFIQAVPNSDDIVAFQFPFELDGKAFDDTVEVLEDGDLIIEGFAASGHEIGSGGTMSGFSGNRTDGRSVQFPRARCFCREPERAIQRF